MKQFVFFFSKLLLFAELGEIEFSIFSLIAIRHLQGVLTRFEPGAKRYGHLLRSNLKLPQASFFVKSST